MNIENNRSAEEQAKTVVQNSYNIKVSYEQVNCDVEKKEEKGVSVKEKKNSGIQDRGTLENRPPYPGCIPPRSPQGKRTVGNQDAADSPSRLEGTRIPQERTVQPQRSALEERRTMPQAADVKLVPAQGPVKKSTNNYPATNSFNALTQDIAKVKKAPVPKPLSQLNSSSIAKPMAASPPLSTKSRTAPPVPVTRSSGSASGRVGLSDLAKDTSGYPDSFNKRRSRGSREITEEEFNRLHKAGVFSIMYRKL